MLWIALVVALISFLAALVGTGTVRYVAQELQMIDVPNFRSSHTDPTPRGGGIAIAAVVLASLLVMVFVLPDQRSSAIALAGGGLAVALVGLLDDRYGLSIKVRLLTHMAAGVWAVSWLGGYDGLESGPSVVLAWLEAALAVFFIVWCTNLYNFMDGIDGLAGSQAMIAGVIGTALFWQQRDDLLMLTMLATAAAAAGFLVWNWPPAKIFMGDCGSGLLGFLFGSMAVAGHQHGSLPMAAGLMLILVFVMDASLTLGRRMLNKEAWYRPHRSHAYQRAVQLGANHGQVTIAASVLFALSACLAWYLTVNWQAAWWICSAFALGLLLIWSVINHLSAKRLEPNANKAGLLGKSTATSAQGVLVRSRTGHPVTLMHHPNSG